MAKLIDINSNFIASGQSVILDTNVWLYLFSPYNQYDYGYSDVLEKLLQSKIKILISPLILSEYVNRVCRQAFESYRQSQPKVGYKKEFRPSSQYKLAFKLAQQSVLEEILPLSTLVQLTDEDVLQSVESPELADLNDDIILNTANRLNASIITHDKDFKNTNRNVSIYRSFTKEP